VRITNNALSKFMNDVSALEEPGRDSRPAHQENNTANNVEKNENRGMQGVLLEDSSVLPTEDKITRRHFCRRVRR
jgi:hypothetical protein